MRKMGGIWRLVPVTYAVMWIGNLSLAGVGIPGLFGFAGFYSKDIILEAAWAAESGVGRYAFWLGLLAAIMTAFYSWRLLLMTFHGRPRADEKVMAHIHESPRVMLVPLIVLALGAVFAGAVGYSQFVGEGMGSFWGDSLLVLPDNESIEAAHHVPLLVKLAPLGAAAIGIALAYLMYMRRPDLPAVIAGRVRALYLLLLNKWYFDEIYDLLFVRFANYLGYGLWKSGDGALIDGVGPDGVAAAARDLAQRASRLQTGYVYHYAFAMLIGVVALVSWYLLARVG